MSVFFGNRECVYERTYAIARMNDCAGQSLCIQPCLQPVVIGQGGEHALELGVVLGLSPDHGGGDLMQHKVSGWWVVGE